MWSSWWTTRVCFDAAYQDETNVRVGFRFNFITLLSVENNAAQQLVSVENNIVGGVGIMGCRVVLNHSMIDHCVVIQKRRESWTGGQVFEDLRHDGGNNSSPLVVHHHHHHDRTVSYSAVVVVVVDD